MVVMVQAVGQDLASLLNKDKAKQTIQEIEHNNQAIRDALVAMVGANATEDDRERALKKLQDENPLFAKAIAEELTNLLRPPVPPVR